jgi:sugar lactone lactonase YvrE
VKAKFKTSGRVLFQSSATAICCGTVVWMAASTKGADLFEGDAGSGNVYAFTPSGAQSTFASGFQSILGLGFNGAGDLFVEDFSISTLGTIYEVGPNGTRTTFACGLLFNDFDFNGIAFDSAGNLYVAAGEGIVKITPGGVQSTFASGGFLGLAFNSAGDLFASCGSSGNPSTSGKIFEFTPAGVESTFASGLSDPIGLAFDGTGDLFVSNYTSGIINQISPFGVASVFASGVDEPTPLACDSQGDVFVATSGNGPGTASIYEFTAGGAQSTFASGLYAPDGLAFQPVPEPSVLAFVGGGTAVFFMRCRRWHPEWTSRESSPGEYPLLLRLLPSRFNSHAPKLFGVYV